MADITISLTDNSDEIKNALKDQLPNALWAIGATAEGYAKDNCPVDTGRLRNSISHAEDNAECAVYIGTNVEYAPYVEEGTSKMAAHHFLRDAATNHTDEYKQILEAAMKA